MAAPFVQNPNGVAMDGTTHELHAHTHSHSHSHSHGHSRSQHRKAVPARAAQGSVGGSLGGSIDAGSQQAYSAPTSLLGTAGHSHGHRNHHKHTPSLQLNGTYSGIPERSPALSAFANSPPINENFPSPQGPRLQHTGISHSHAPYQPHTHSHSLPHFHDHEHSHDYEPNDLADGKMASQDLRHITSDESSALGRDSLTSEEIMAATVIPLPLLLSACLRGFYTTEPGAETTQIVTSLSLFDILLTSSIVLLSVGSYAKLSAPSKPTRSSDASLGLVPALFTKRAHLETILGRILSLALPFFALVRLGTSRTVAFILTAVVTRLLPWGLGRHNRAQSAVFTKFAKANKFALGALTLHLTADAFGFTSTTSVQSLLPGYVALAISIIILPIPFRTQQRDDTDGKETMVAKRSSLVASPLDVDLSCAAGILGLLMSTASYVTFSSSLWPSFSSALIGAGTISAAMVAALLLPDPARLVSRYKVGYGFALCIPVVTDYYFNFSSGFVTLAQSVLLALTWGGVFFDTHLHADSNQFHRRRGNSIRPNNRHSHGVAANKQMFWISRWLVANTVHYPVLHSILSEDDSRPVFYFMLLNLAFMCIQAFYSIVTGSLGLLSDSIHMFFDCFALALGLAAAVMSKWPPSVRFPYGLGMLNTLAGFGNGVFLMLISIEIIWEASERMIEGLEMNRLKELFIVSVMGMLVNLVGLVAVGHEHHHHGHGHSHGHSHAHVHSHDHSHEHDHAHGFEHSHDHSHDHDHSHEHGNTHSHTHDENSFHTPHASQNFSFPKSEPSPLGTLDPNTQNQRTNPLHSHTNSHGHSHSPNTHTHSAGHAHHGHSHGHSHDHGNENMLGIWLHIMADALGSLAVIISTVLIHYTGQTWWDPLASIIIAVLIFASAVPLVQGCARKLLLTNPESLEFDLKGAVQAVSGLRGVTGVCVPRFWSVELGEGEEKVHGVMHIIASTREPLDEVRKRAEGELGGRGFQVVVQVERESEGRCWCGGGKLRI